MFQRRNFLISVFYYHGFHSVASELTASALPGNFVDMQILSPILNLWGEKKWRVDSGKVVQTTSQKTFSLDFLSFFKFKCILTEIYNYTYHCDVSIHGYIV